MSSSSGDSYDLESPGCINYMQYGGGCDGGYSVQRKYIITKWKIISTDVLHHQYRGDTSSVTWRVCSLELSHNQYGGGCAIKDCRNWSG